MVSASIAVAFGVIALSNPLFAIGAGALGFVALVLGGKSVYNALNNSNNGKSELVKSDKDL